MLQFFQPRDLGPREWGTETLIAHTDKYIGKILYMKAGSRGGLQYHKEKDETAHVFSGILQIEWDKGDGKLVMEILGAGESVHIQPGTVHRETAMTDCIIFETSTPHFDDRVRVEEQYGEKQEGGLPST